VLKKVGIVAAAATAGMLALSPLAFATDNNDGHGDKDRGNHTSVWYDDSENQSIRCVNQENESRGDGGDLIDLDDLSGLLVNAPVQNCINANDGSYVRTNARGEFEND
jgi:hypothetical protein